MYKLFINEIQDAHARENFKLLEAMQPPNFKSLVTTISFPGEYRLEHSFQGVPQSVLISSDYVVDVNLLSTTATHITFRVNAVPEDATITVKILLSNIPMESKQAEPLQ